MVYTSQVGPIWRFCALPVCISVHYHANTKFYLNISTRLQIGKGIGKMAP